MFFSVHKPHITLAAISNFKKSNLVCRVAVKAINVRLIDDTKKLLQIKILKASEKEQAVLAGGDKTKHSVKTQQGEICHRESL